MCSFVSRKLFNTSRFLYKNSYIKSCEFVKLSRNLVEKRLCSTNQPDKLFPQENKHENDEESNLSPEVKIGYKEFRDEDAEIILDVDEEMKKLDLEKINALEHEIDPYADLNLKHGLTGVFDVEELVDILRKNKAQNIFVAKVPLEYMYVNHIVVVSGKSHRHMSALTTYVRKAFKLKKYSHDIIPKVEGKNCKDWMALDLGNIALHVFSSTAREKYDLETLWAVGPEYDRTEENQTEDTFHDKYKAFLDILQPADSDDSTSNSIKQ